MRYKGFGLICAIIAAKRCQKAGHSIERIARSAKVSPSTIRRWLAKLPR